MNLDEFLYPTLLHTHWQMSPSERMAMCHILERIQPKLAIEIGTYKGGSLSLLSHHSGWVYSIDVDPEIPEKFAQFKNTTFITEDSGTSLPKLLSRLTLENAPLEFVLIDGDHSAEGVRRDLNAMLRFTPSRRVIVMLHDSFNPHCRRGMLEAEWSTARHVAFADLDFVHGKIVQQGGPFDGQMWGGLAVVVLEPEIQPPPQVITSSQLMEDACVKWAST